MRKILILMCALLGLGVSGAWAETVTWTPGLEFAESTNGNFSTGWFTVVAPINGTLNSFTVNLGTGGGNSIYRTDAYLAISRDLKSNTTGFDERDFVAISNESCTTNGSKITLTFNSDAVLNGGSTYYFYWVTESSGVYTTVNQRYYVASSTQMSVGTVGTTTASSSAYAMPFSATMTIADNKYYRIKALYPDGICYLYSNESNEDKIWKNTSAPSVTALRYVWKATLSTGLILQNVGSSRYIPKLTTGTYTGAQVDYLTATTTDDAEKFSLEDNNPNTQNQPGFIALKSNTAASDVWLNTATSGNAYVGSHNANPNKSGQFLFYQVKKVTFSTPVAVNGGDEVSTIYVAVDGSDSFTLPEGYIYEIGGTQYSNTDAAAKIAAAGTDDISVTVITIVYDSDGNELVDDATYRITLRGATNALYLNGTAVGVQSYSGSESQIWKAKKNSDGTYKFSAPADNTYWQVTSYSEGANKIVANAAEGSATSWDLIRVGSQYNITSVSGNTRYYFSNYGGVNNNMGFYNSDTTTDSGSLFTFVKVEGITYRCETVGGRVLASGTGYFQPSTSGAPTFTGYTCNSYEVVEDTYVFTYSLTSGVPFTASPAPTENAGTLEFSTGTNWYIVAQHSNNTRYWQLSGSVINGATDYSLVNNDYIWCFVGSEAAGFQIYNRNGKAVSFETGGSANVSGISASVFEIRPSQIEGKCAFWLKDATEGTRSYLNMNGTVKDYNQADAGSAFHSFVAIANTIMTIAEASGNRDMVGCYTTADAGAIQTAVINYGMSRTEANFQNLLDTYASKSIIEIEEGVYYKIVNATSNKGLLRTMNGKISTSRKDGNDGTATQIWQFEEAEGGKYYIKNVASGKYIGAIPTSANANIPMSDDAVAITVESNTTDVTKKIIYSSSDNVTYKYIHESTGHEYGVIVWGSGADASHWTIEPVAIPEITMLNPTALSAAAGTVNVYMSYANNTGETVQLPADVNIYKVLEGGTKTEVKMQKVTSNAIPASGGVIIEAMNGVKIPLLPTDATESLEDNLLIQGGSSAEGYLLAYKKDGDGTPKFYYMSLDNLEDNKAYLPLSYFGASSGVKELTLNFGIATTIQSVEAGTDNNSFIFNLAGQRVNKAQKGIYIVNGKKVLVK